MTDAVEAGGLPPRPSGFRDVRLFVIATEGASTEPHYFRTLIRKGLVPKALHVVVVPTPKTGPEANWSAPRHVLARGLGKVQEFAHSGDWDDDLDMLWMVVDVDSDREGNLNEIATAKHVRTVHLAVSNPCFELWTLLHVADVQAHPRGAGPFGRRRQRLATKQSMSTRNNLPVPVTPPAPWMTMAVGQPPTQAPTSFACLKRSIRHLRARHHSPKAATFASPPAPHM